MKLAVAENQIAPLIADAARALLHTRSLMDGRFSDTDGNWGADREKGPLTSLQGLRTLFGTVAALADDEGTNVWALLQPNLESLFDEWRETLRDLDKGYSAVPYDMKNALKLILAERRTGKADPDPYVDTVSWALSTSILFNYVAGVASARAIPFPSDLVAATRRQLVKALSTLIAAQSSDGGWTWTRDLDTGHLYFTWCAVEGLADFYDYVVGESEKEIGVSADDEMLALINAESPEVMAKVDVARGKASDFLATRYLKKAVSVGLAIEDVEDARLAWFDKSNQSPLVYFELYLLESLILLGYDAPTKVDWKAKRDRLVSLYERVLKRFRELRQLPDNDPFWKDPNVATLRLQLVSTKIREGRQLEPFTISDPGLWAQFLRTMVLYRFYTDQTKSLDADIVGPDGALALLLKERRSSGEQPGDGLWDTSAHNLLITARAIEGLIDVADYYARLRNQQPQAGPPEKPLDLATALAQAVYPHIAQMMTAAPARAPLSETVPSISQTALPMNREDFQRQLLATIEDAIGVLPATSVGGVNRQQLLAKAIGVDKVQRLQADNKNASELLEGLVWLTFCSAVRVFDVILHDAVLHQLVSLEPKRGETAVRKFVKTDTETVDRRSLLDRLSLALKEVADSEVRLAEKNQNAPPDYGDMIKRGVDRAATAPKGK